MSGIKEQPSTTFPAEIAWERLDPAKPFRGDWMEFRHPEQAEFLHTLARKAPFDIGLSEIGASNEGRALHALRFGRGQRRVLLWARQHGNEADCTAALSMVLEELLLSSAEPHCAFILDRLRFAVLPMVNPDGVERFTRRNAQGIDLNRDAIATSGSESQALIRLRDELQPEYCFNLHDMNPRKSTPEGDLVALAFQAGPFEQRDIDNEVRLKAKMVCGLMAETARRHAPVNISRYTADYMHRAFGDSMMRWGISSILIEAGGWYPGKGGDSFVRRLFALSLLRGLYAIAADEDLPPSGAAYETIPFDSGRFYVDIVLEKGEVLAGTGSPLFRADVAVNRNRVPDSPGEPLTPLGTIENLGDLEDDLTLERLSFKGLVLLPGLVGIAPSWKPSGPVPTVEEARPFLTSGITTVVTGTGPFADETEREEWLRAIGGTISPINIMPFERVTGLAEITERGGMTELAGFVVQGLSITRQELVELDTSGEMSSVPGDRVTVDLYFQGAASRTDTRVHLHLGASGKNGKTTELKEGELAQFLNRHLSGLEQVFFGRGRIVKYPNDAFRMGTLGKIEVGQRADIAAFSRESLASLDRAQADFVMLNGEIVLDRRRGIESTGRGSWFLATRPKER